MRIRVPGWIDKGVRFECQPNCGTCCQRAIAGENDGAPGVWLTDADVVRLKKHTGLSPLEFTAREENTVWIRVVAKPDGACLFLGPVGECTVYEARPEQCRTFPFWPGAGSPIESRAAWRRFGRECPGVGNGPVRTRKEIAAAMRGAVVAGFEV